MLIDPAAHGGHRETDLAMLALFGCPHWDFVVGGYLGQHRLDAAVARAGRACTSCTRCWSTRCSSAPTTRAVRVELARRYR